MAISVTDLPPKYQAQAVKKYMEQQARRGHMPSAAAVREQPKGTKYHNTPTERVMPSGAVLRFDSQKEARRYDYLIERERAGLIRDLRLQVDFTLQEAYTDTEGRRVRAIRYRGGLHIPGGGLPCGGGREKPGHQDQGIPAEKKAHEGPLTN